MNYYPNIKRKKFKVIGFTYDYLWSSLEHAIIRDDFPGFKEDYEVVHQLIKKYTPKSFLEIGTNSGAGTNVICNAMTSEFPVYSIDLPAAYDMELIYSKVNPEDGRPDNVGQYCKFKYIQLWGNSKDYDFSKHYPLEAWFIDGKHNYEYAKCDTESAMKADAKLIIWHDTQIDEVQNAIIDTIDNLKYDLFYIENTRISFAIKK